MLYQKLLVGVDPYIVAAGDAVPFRDHRHPEIELSYCLEGSYAIGIDQREYTLQKGDLAIVEPMAAHYLTGGENSRMLTIEVGPAFLGQSFSQLSSLGTDGVFLLNDSQSQSLRQEIIALLEDTAHLYFTRPAYYSLAVKGNLYKLCALLLQLPTKGNPGETGALVNVARVDQALMLIYEQYDQPLNLDDVSRLCGYSKSNFCRVFKSVTGDTFHNTLNRHRVDIACVKLRSSSATVEEIAFSVGFADVKSFCRTFRNCTGISAREYRKT